MYDSTNSVVILYQEFKIYPDLANANLGMYTQKR